MRVSTRSGVLAAWVAVWLTTGCGGIAIIDPDGGPQTGSSSSGGFQTRCYSPDEALTLADALEYAQSGPLPRDSKLVSVRSNNMGELDRCGKSVGWEFFYNGLVFIQVGPGGVEEVLDAEQPCDDEITPIDSESLLPDAAARVAEIDPTPATADGYTSYFLEQASLCGAHLYQVTDHPLVTVLRQWPEVPHNWPNYLFSVHYDTDGSFSKICGPCDPSVLSKPCTCSGK